MAESDVQRSNCPVCKEQYDDDGEHIPRFFPCHCTACTTCILTLIQENPNSIWVICPVCKKNQKTAKNIEKFPTNQYIIGNIRERRKSSSLRAHEKEVKFSMCPSHGQELSLYCPVDQCKKTICPNCLIKDHAAHAGQVLDLTEKKERLLAEINSLSKDLEKEKSTCLKEKELVLTKNEKCIASIEARKKDMFAEFDAMIKKVADFTPEVIQTIEKFENFLITLKQMGSCEMSYDDILADLESVANIRRSYKNISSKKYSNQYYEYSYEYSRNNPLGAVKLTTVTEEKTKRKVEDGLKDCGRRGIGHGNEKEALNKAHGSERSGPSSKGGNRKECVGDTERDGFDNEGKRGIYGSENEGGAGRHSSQYEEGRNALNNEAGRERDEGGRKGDGSHNERERDGFHSDSRNERPGPYNEDGRRRGGPRIEDNGVSFEDASTCENEGGARNTDMEGSRSKRRRKQSPAQILRHAKIPHMEPWSNPIGIRCHHVMACVQVDNSKVLVCGKYEKVTNAWSELIEYSLKDGRLLNRTTLRGEPYGVTEVMLHGKWCLALTYESKENEIKAIDFYDSNSKRICSYSTEPHLPGLLCTVSPTTLLYEYRDKRKNMVRKLNCEGEASVPKLVKDTPLQSTFTKQSQIKCMCAVKFKGEELVITTHNCGSHSEMYAYNIERGLLRLVVTNTQRDFGFETNIAHQVCKIDCAHAIAADSHGNIVVYNFESKKAHKFLANEKFESAKTLSGLFKEDRQINDPKMIRWCPITSSWIICNQKIGSAHNWYINIFNERL